MKVLLHICCGPCSIYLLQDLKKENHEVTGYWYNNNIHPYTEYKNRLESLNQYAKNMQIHIVYKEQYELREFLVNTINNPQRCSYCYKTRLEETVKYAKENGYEAFSTTLLVSPYQDHNCIKKLSEELSKKYNVYFIYKDYRLGFREGQKVAKTNNLYMQKYCGCIFSEEERYLKKK